MATSPLSRNEQKVHYYKPHNGVTMVPIPGDLIEGILSHSKSYNLNIMQTSLFNFKNTDQINIAKCLIDVNPLFKVNERDWQEMNKENIFKDFPGSSAPHIVLIEGKPGSGKTSFTRKQAFNCSNDFTSCHKEGPSIPCKGHDWVLMVYVSADTMSNAPMKQIIRDALRCKEKDEDILLSYIFDDGEGILVGFDAIDEIHDDDLRKGLQSFSRQTTAKKNGKGKEGIKILLTTRTGLSLIDEEAVDRFLSLDGFTIKQGIEYFRLYLENIHGKQDPGALNYVREYGGRLEAVLRNPLMTHIFSELAACNKIPFDELLTRTPIQLLRCLEHHVVRRDSPGVNPATEKYCHELYRLCLQCLVQGIRQIPESMLERFSVPLDSPYFSFMNRHPTGEGEAYYTFVHEVIFEYLAAAGLVFYLDDASIQDSAKKAVILSLAADPRMRTALEMTCGFITHYREDLESYITSIVRANIILQHPGNNCSSTETTKDLFLLPRKIRDIATNDVLSTEFGTEPSRVVLEVWQMVQDAFEQKSSELKEAGWITSLHQRKDLPNLQTDLANSMEGVVRALQTTMTTEQLYSFWNSVRAHFLPHSTFMEEPVHSTVQNMKAFLQLMKGPEVADDMIRNLTYDDPSTLKFEYVEAVLQIFKAIPTQTVIAFLGPLKDFLEKWFSRNIMENVSPLLEHAVRCLSQSTESKQQHRLYDQTINCLLPSHGEVNGNMTSIFPVSNVRWAIMWETDDGPHLYASCPDDMVQALHQNNREPQSSTSLAVLLFDVSSGWWGDRLSGWTKETVQSMLMSLHKKYGKIRHLHIGCKANQLLHPLMDCLPGSTPLPGMLFLSTGIIHLAYLKQWIQRCKAVKLMTSLYGMRISVPNDMSTVEVTKEHQLLTREVPGIILSAHYRSEAGVWHNINDK